MSGEGGLRGRPAAVSDVAAITRIYNQGIADGTATFETRLREDDDVMGLVRPPVSDRRRRVGR